MAKKTPKPAERRKRGAEDHILGERQNIIDTAERDFFASTGLSPFVTWKKGEMEAALRRAKAFGGPVIVHAVTRKGNGYAHAENDVAEQMHATGKMDPATGVAHGSAAPDWTSVFSEELVKQGAARPEVVALTAAMPGPTGLRAFGEEYP